jgi:EPS-associated MarR family transcriptional regulator
MPPLECPNPAEARRPLVRSTPTAATFPRPVNEDLTFRALRHLEANPELSQRELARALGISLGRTNYCLRALAERGLVKVRNFRRNDHKRAYAYCLTPAGIEQKARLISRFLQRKEAEYEALQAEIEQLRAEVAAARVDS